MGVEKENKQTTKKEETAKYNKILDKYNCVTVNMPPSSKAFAEKRVHKRINETNICAFFFFIRFHLIDFILNDFSVEFRHDETMTKKMNKKKIIHIAQNRNLF